VHRFGGELFGEPFLLRGGIRAERAGELLERATMRVSIASIGRPLAASAALMRPVSCRRRLSCVAFSARITSVRPSMRQCAGSSVRSVMRKGLSTGAMAAPARRASAYSAASGLPFLEKVFEMSRAPRERRVKSPAIASAGPLTPQSVRK
jgi:hypothetical protein